MKNLKRDIEEVERLLDELVHRRLTDHQVLQGFILHYVIHDMTLENVEEELVNGSVTYSDEQIKSALVKITLILGRVARGGELDIGRKMQ